MTDFEKKAFCVFLVVIELLIIFTVLMAFCRTRESLERMESKIDSTLVNTEYIRYE